MEQLCIMKLDVSENGFCIFIRTLCQGVVPSSFDEGDRPVFYREEIEARREIAEYTIERLQQFLRGERDFEDAITVEEYIAPVTRYADGTIIDDAGRCYGPY